MLLACLVLFGLLIIIKAKECSFKVKLQFVLVYVDILTSCCCVADSDGVCVDIDGVSAGDVTVDKTLQYSIWVSFYEIYNEFVYDLLEPPMSLHTQKRNTLRLSDDKHGNVYVKGKHTHSR